MKWFKDNWLIALLGVIVALVIWMQFQQDGLYGSLMDKYKEQAAAHTAELAAMEAVNETWRAERDRLDSEYNERLENIQTEFNDQLAKVSKQRLRERRSLVKAAREDPSILTKEVRRVFGIPIYKPQQEKTE